MCIFTITNKKLVMKLKNCPSCQKAIPERNKYCSVRCQQSFQTNERIKTWLRDGVTSISGSFNYLKRYLLIEQKERCAICQIPTVWNNKPLRFVCDHIDGNSENNSRVNLRLICANCDSQLPTFKNRNKGHGRHSRRLRYSQDKSY